MTDTKTQLLDAAAGLAQTRGYNGFSFHDLSAQVGIKTASIHYHFPTKAMLVESLVHRYIDNFFDALGQADVGPPEACLERYVGLFRRSLGEGRMCLCGMMGAEIGDLPASVAGAVRSFFDANLDWLTHVYERMGARQAATRAQLLLATLEGAMMMARVSQDAAGFDSVARAAIARE